MVKGWLWYDAGLWTRPAESGEEIQRVRKEEGAVMMKSVANEPFGNRSLRGTGFESRMGVNRCHRRIKSGVRDAPDAHSSIVMRSIFHQPLDGVVSVGALVDVLRPLLYRNVGTHVDELSLRFVPPADILIHEDVALLAK